MMQPTVRLFVSVLGLFILTACGSTGSTTPPEAETGTVAGRMDPAAPSASGPFSTGMDIPRLERGPDLSIHVPTDAPNETPRPSVVPGEIIVKFRDSTTLGALGMLRVELDPEGTGDSVTLRTVRSLTVSNARLYRAPGLSEAATVGVAERLALRSDVEYAIPNRIYHPTASPNDTYYPLQWHYPAIGMPAAWDLTTGTEVVVAVVDSGILYAEGRSDLSHPDFFDRVLPGYDFVSDPSTSGDGDGRDPLPYDLNEFFHGSHVAGTIAAATNNGRGVAGVNWRAKIVPVRVIGRSNGSLIDIMEGAFWAAGGRIGGIPANPNPARIINMSLGGRGACSPYERDVFDRIFAAGAIVIVSAGNQNDDANRYAPASCPGVITVGATDALGERAPYSNYGPRIDVMAPGGDMTADTNGDGSPDGVLSPGFDVATRQFSYRFLEGTSMAAPHVAGVVSLMLAVDPMLTTSEALALLRNTADPLTPAACNRDAGSDCGSGIIDAFSALQGTQGSGPPAAPGGVLAFNPDPVDFGVATSVSITLVNTGSTSVSYGVSAYEPSPSNPGELLDGAVFGSPLSGSIPAGGSTRLDLGIDRTKATADGMYAFELIFSVGTSEQRLLARFGKNVAAGAPTGPTIVASFMVDEDGNLVIDANGDARLAGSVATSQFSSQYTFEAEPGDQVVIGWIDQNANVEVDDGDFIGIFPDTVVVQPGETTSGIDFRVANVYDMGALTEAMEAMALATELRLRPPSEGPIPATIPE